MKRHLSGILFLLILVLLLTSCGPGLEERGSVTSETGPAAVGGDPCLEGYWVMSNEDVNALMSSLVSIPGLSIPLGTLGMDFIDGDWS